MTVPVRRRRRRLDPDTEMALLWGPGVKDRPLSDQDVCELWEVHERTLLADAGECQRPWIWWRLVAGEPRNEAEREWDQLDRMGELSDEERETLSRWRAAGTAEPETTPENVIEIDFKEQAK